MKEIETTLIVCSSEPYEVVKRLAELDAISEYALVPQATQNIKDTYFDKRDQALQSRKLGLRIRDVNGEQLITLKGPSKIAEGGVKERLELELKWSEAGLGRVVEELKNWGFETAGLHKGLDFEQPLRVLSELGLEVKQERENSREVRNVVRKGDAGNVLAELVIDSLTFNFKNLRVHHKEVEIEAKSADGVRLLKSLNEELHTIFPLDLMMWDHSKLAIGLAVGDMADSGDLEAFLDEDNNLKPEAYSRIDSYLQAREV